MTMLAVMDTPNKNGTSWFVVIGFLVLVTVISFPVILSAVAGLSATAAVLAGLIVAVLLTLVLTLAWKRLRRPS